LRRHIKIKTIKKLQEIYKYKQFRFEIIIVNYLDYLYPNYENYKQLEYSNRNIKIIFIYQKLYKF